MSRPSTAPVAVIDSSTQATKVVVCDAATDRVIRSGRALHPDASDVQPSAWWDALKLACSGGLLDGVAAVAAARLAGAKTIIVSDFLEQRRALALELDADYADYAVAPHELFDISRDATKGTGTDVTLRPREIPMWRPRLYELPAKLDVRSSLAYVMQGVVCSLSHVFQKDFMKAVLLIDDGEVKMESLISDGISLPEVVERGFEALVTEPNAHLKIIVHPQMAEPHG